MAVMKEKRKFNFILLAVLVVVIIAGIFYQFFLKF
jgi:flagellar basal body-associated protein FliL